MTPAELLERIRAQVADPEKQQLAAELTAELFTLTMRHAAGEDVEREIVHVESQALNLAREHRLMIAREINDWLVGTIAGVLARAVPGA